jgi:hypothetical protein
MDDVSSSHAAVTTLPASSPLISKDSLGVLLLIRNVEDNEMGNCLLGQDIYLVMPE